MDVIDIDTDQLSSSLAHDPNLHFTSLSRSSSQLSTTSFSQGAAPAPLPASTSSPYAPTSSSRFHFQSGELEDSTFYVPPTSLQHQQTGQSLAFPTFDRGLSSLSTSSEGAAKGWSAWPDNAPIDSSAAWAQVPLGPFRDSTGMSTYDDTGAPYSARIGESAAYDAQMSYAPQPPLPSSQLPHPPAPVQPSAPYALQHQHLQLQAQLQAQLSYQHQQAAAAKASAPAAPASALPSVHPLSSPYPNLNLDLAPHPLPATTLSASADYDPSRKRQRGGDTSAPAPAAATPYYVEPTPAPTPTPYYASPAPPTPYLPSVSPSLQSTHSAPGGRPAPVAAIAAAIPPSGLVVSTVGASSVSSPTSATQAGEAPTRVYTAPAVPSRRVDSASTPTPSQAPDDSYDVASSRDSESPSAGEEVKELQKKVKHQMTDRQRRAKIKESMDQLKALVPLDNNQKADQATIVAESVDMIKGMKDEMVALRARIQELELAPKGDAVSDATRKSILQQSYASSSPFSAMMASLNGAGVSMWRMGLDGRVLEVNLVFEMVTGFSGADVVNRSPCAAPLYGSLSVMPKSFLRYFSTVSAAVSTPMIGDLTGPPSPVSTASTGSVPSSPTEDLPFSSATPQRVASASSPLFSNVTISNLPIVPHSELQSFFPFKCKQLPSVLPNPTTGSNASSTTTPATPLPHGQYLMNHLSNLPPNHVLKLLSRVSTSYGDTLESIQTMTLVRTPQGAPDYILCLTTPDGRRLVKPTKFLANFSVAAQPPAAAPAAAGEAKATAATVTAL